MDFVFGWLLRLKYIAMFAILLLCGIGLPIPEEVTLISSGLLVGWHEADFVLASLACVGGILAGDSVIFWLGHHYGPRIMQSRLMRLLVNEQRQTKVADNFREHAYKAIFFARFFVGIRIGVYAYAGSHGVPWLVFLGLDLLGCLISGPTSIALGAWAAHQFAEDRAQATVRATELVHRFGFAILGVAVAVIATLVILHFVRKRQAQARAASPSAAQP